MSESPRQARMREHREAREVRIRDFMKGPNAALCFVRARLRRRLFAWFVGTTLITGLAVALAMSFGDGGPSGWHREIERTRAFVGDAFERAWDDPAERTALAKTISRDLDVTVRVTDAQGAELTAVGPACERARFDAPVTRDGVRVGSVSICAARYASRPYGIVIPLLLAAAMVWAAAGAIASKLSRPFGEIARVAREIGSGNLKARVEVRRHHHGEVGIVACAMNDMAERIEAHVAEQRQLLASVSHEMRTPLARIRLLTELGRGSNITEPKTFDELDREVMEMDALVGDLLASSRMDFRVLSPRPIDVVEAAGRALERAGEDASKLVVEEGQAEVNADATLLARALANLIDNAKKHGGGLDTLRVGRQNGSVILSAEDSGEGFVVGEEQRVFEPFFRRGENGSLGLGLALVKRIAEAHHGAVFAENKKDGGARVGMELPVA